MCLNVAQRPCHWLVWPRLWGERLRDEKPGLKCDRADGTLGYTAAKGARPWLGEGGFPSDSRAGRCEQAEGLDHLLHCSWFLGSGGTSSLKQKEGVRASF